MMKIDKFFYSIILLIIKIALLYKQFVKTRNEKKNVEEFVWVVYRVDWCYWDMVWIDLSFSLFKVGHLKLQKSESRSMKWSR